MKKRILSYATIIFSTFLLTSRVNAISCEYGVFDSANSTADGFESKITLIFDKNQGSITIDYNNSPFIKDSEYCSNTSNEGSGLTNNSGNTISCKYWNIGHWDQKNYILGDTLAQETLDYTLKAYGDECRKNINVYDQTIFYTSSETVPSVTNNDDSAILYNYPACITFEEDQEALPCEGEYSDAISYTFFLKGTTEADRKMAEEENCFFYDIYEKNLVSTLSDGKCEGNSDFTREYQKFSSRCANYLSSHLYTSQEEGSDEYHANPCASKCAALRDSISRMCKYEDNGDSCGSLGARLLNWIYRMIKFVRYGVPALLIILSILDFIKAIASESDDEMKKVTARFTKRLIAAALIFIIPFILDFILRMFNIPGLDAENPFCSQ